VVHDAIGKLLSSPEESRAVERGADVIALGSMRSRNPGAIRADG
jgi:hypothetical protein